MKRFATALGAMAACASCLATAAMAQTVQEAAEAFGARQSVLDISISPSGTKIAIIAPSGGSGEAIRVVDLAGNAVPRAILVNSDIRDDISYCDWMSEDRLVCGIFVAENSAGMLLGFTRLVIVNADGSGHKFLSRSLGSRALGISQDGGDVIALEIADRPGKILMTREFVPEMTTGSLTASKAEGLGVEEVDVADLRRRRVEQPNRDATRYIADDSGRVRVMVRHPFDSAGRLGPKRFYYYRTADSNKWLDIESVEVDAQTRVGFVPVAVDAATNRAFGFDEHNGFDALFTFALDGTGRRELIVGRNDVDVDRLIRIGRRNRVVGASYATEKRQVQYIDPELAALAKGLAAVLPGKPLVDIVDASADENQLLIVASSDVDPGMSYIYDKQSRQLAELLPIRNELVGRKLGAMHPVSIPAADGTVIPGYLTLPPGVADAQGLPAIVLPHGGPSARDEWGFDWLVQFFTARGYAVLQPNYRGSSGYGTAWFGRNGFQAWKTAIADVNDAGRWLVSQGIADPERMAVVGWSYGGYAALQSQVLDQQLYKAIVAIAPVTDLERLREDARPFTNFSLVDRFIGQGPHVKAGSPAQHASEFAAPVMLVHGTFDQNVDVQQSRLMKQRLESAGKRVRYLEFKDLDHSLSDSDARTKMLMEIDGFLTASLAR
ncbi:MAG: peptidase S9 [Erythrobacter sp. RIFCSPHIGHO2_12_FULL_63_10]|nr:MAG: peptidase S9 [Erythrobacter sp. RIFCSPHIGHO2_12_FULL_63_10]